MDFFRERDFFNPGQTLNFYPFAGADQVVALTVFNAGGNKGQAGFSHSLQSAEKFILEP
jgi:hypothetical protein